MKHKVCKFHFFGVKLENLQPSRSHYKSRTKNTSADVFCEFILLPAGVNGRERCTELGVSKSKIPVPIIGSDLELPPQVWISTS